MTNLVLGTDELEAITKKKRSHAQAKVLKFLGIDYKPRPDGSLAVLRKAVEDSFGVGVASKPRRKVQPDFSRVP